MFRIEFLRAAEMTSDPQTEIDNISRQVRQFSMIVWSDIISVLKNSIGYRCMLLKDVRVHAPIT